jgi:hypothetical protein
MNNRPKKRSTISAIGCVLLATSCAADDPLTIAGPPEPTTTTTLEADLEPAPTTTAPAIRTTATPTTTSTTTVAPTTTQPTRHDDVPDPILAAITNLWPEPEWNRALTVARCESNYRLDAANPTSSARGVFQLLGPWTRDPGSGRTVWGWDYTDSGEKLSAAAGLGIAEDDARYGLDNIAVAHAIWSREGWSPWNASRHCWAGS